MWSQGVDRDGDERCKCSQCPRNFNSLKTLYAIALSYYLSGTNVYICIYISQETKSLYAKEVKHLYAIALSFYLSGINNIYIFFLQIPIANYIFRFLYAPTPILIYNLKKPVQGWDNSYEKQILGFADLSVNVLLNACSSR